MSMNKRVYGILGISSIMANWNADFTGHPKTTSDGTVFGSDKALKYPIKKLWENQGEKVLYIKSLKKEKDKKEGELINPKSLKERYEEIFGVNKLEDETPEMVTRKLFTAIDVKNFGATFAESKKNISITGAVQIGQGFNKYANTFTEEQQILSPFRNSKKDSEDSEDKNSTLGTKIVSNEAHYFYPFVINPLAYKEYIGLGVTEGYQEEDYAAFKKASLVGATAHASNSKIGCENEFALFVETEITAYLPNLSKYVIFEKGQDKNIIELTCIELLNSFSKQIQNIEIYYNPYTTVLKSIPEGAKCFNIFTQEEV